MKFTNRTRMAGDMSFAAGFHCRFTLGCCFRCKFWQQLVEWHGCDTVHVVCDRFDKPSQK